MIWFEDFILKLTKFFLRFSKSFLIKFIGLIQLFKYRILGHSFSRDGIELFKHFLNFYELNLKARKKIKVKQKFYLGLNIKNKQFLNLDINKFSSYEGFYVFNGPSPLLNFSKQIYENPKIKVIDSYLYDFYKSFKPKSYGELYGLKKTNRLSDISSFNDFKPWIHSFPNTQTMDKGIFGPVDKKEILHRFLRIKNIISNLRKYGYAPSKVDIIKGYLLISKDDYRFLITSGHHRIAAMKAINFYNPGKFKDVLVKIDSIKNVNNAFYEKDIDRWPAVKENFCSIEEARELFYKFFEV